MENNNIDSTLNISGNAVKKVSLGKNDSKNVKKVTNLMVDIIKRQKTLWRKEIDDWQFGRLARYNTEMPQNYPLQEVYMDVMMDGHLTGITGNRTLRTTNKNYIFAIDGKKDDALTKYIKNKDWFENTIQNAHESTYYGGQLLWVKKFEKGEIKEVERVERGRIIPERKVILYDIYSDKGIDFSEIKDLLWYCQFYDPVGLLEKAAVYAILKRHSWGSWDEFEELFGVPIRIAKIASQSVTVKKEVAGWLEEMGSAPYAVFPKDTDIEIKENSKNDSFQVFYKKIEALDKELSKLVLHQTMTTENGSSQSQANVHENTLGEVTTADEKKMISFLNHVVVPAMKNLGYKIPDNAEIIIEKTKDASMQIIIDKEFMTNGYVLQKEYIEKTYGTKIAFMPGENEAKEGKD